MCCRAIWSKKLNDAELLIANKRITLEKELTKLEGVLFLISCVTGIKFIPFFKKTKSENEIMRHYDGKLTSIGVPRRGHTMVKRRKITFKRYSNVV